MYNGVLERTKQSAHLHPPLHSKLEHMLFPTNSSNSSTKLLGGSREVLFPFEVSKKAQGKVSYSTIRHRLKVEYLRFNLGFYPNIEIHSSKL